MFKNMKIGMRLSLGFGTVLVLMAIMTVIGITQLSSLSSNINLLVDDRYPKTVWANNVINNINIIARSLRNAILVTDLETQKREMDRIAEARGKIKENINKLEQTIGSQRGKELLRALQEVRSANVSSQDRLVQWIREGQHDQALSFLVGNYRNEQRQYFDAINNLLEYQGTLMRESGEEAITAYHSARNTMLGLALFAAVVGIGIAIWVTHSITRPLGSAVELANAMAQGDLT